MCEKSSPKTRWAKVGFYLFIFGSINLLILIVLGMYLGIRFLPANIEIIWVILGLVLIGIGLNVILYFYSQNKSGNSSHNGN